MVLTRPFGKLSTGEEITEFTIASDAGLVMKVINYGCTITSLRVPYRNGLMIETVLGFDRLEEYISSPHYIGSVIGRYSNRIGRGSFLLEGQKISLTRNHGQHHLHGGMNGFDKKAWHAVPFEDGSGVKFHYTSLHDEEGYPGQLDTEVKYFFDRDSNIHFQYDAKSDRTTIVNLTQHSYFNLKARKSDIRNHFLRINANHFLPVNHDLLPTGEVRHVAGTPFDLRSNVVIDAALNQADDQIKIAGGFDHSWVLQKQGEEMNYAATLSEPESGLSMDVFTTEPGVQVYTGNHLNTGGYYPFSGVCLETQHFPDSPNIHAFPSVVLHEGEEYRAETVLKFYVEEAQ